MYLICDLFLNWYLICDLFKMQLGTYNSFFFFAERSKINYNF